MAGSKGGKTRTRILLALSARPSNAHQLSEELSLDYTTVRHHLATLKKYQLITIQGEGYGNLYFLSDKLEKNLSDFKEICKTIGLSYGSSEHSGEEHG
ncbi:MAG: winged helix-turn-helix domain-containing protein [Methanoregula sp.]|nr:winged helix-turn-helix domain-containing protein [Methanoregula sp.]